MLSDPGTNFWTWLSFKFVFSTVEERAKRLFGTKGKTLEEIDASLFAKTKPGKKSSKEEKDTEKHKETALLEAQISK